MNTNHFQSRADAHTIAGVSLDSHTFVGRVEAALLLSLVPDPSARDLDAPWATDGEIERSSRGNHTVIDHAYRIFNGTKTSNISDYTNYLLDTTSTETDSPFNRVNPAIVLWAEDNLIVESFVDGLGYLRIPYHARLIALDGQTQIAARYHARQRSNSDMEREPIPVIFCHGRPAAWAKQTLFDLNTKAISTCNLDVVDLNSRDPMMRLALRLYEDYPMFQNQVAGANHRDSQTQKLRTLNALRIACITLNEGLAGIQATAGQYPALETSRMERLNEAANLWFDALRNRYERSLHSDDHVLTYPAVLAALGAIGHELVDFGYGEDRDVLAWKLVHMGPVNWARGEHWEGIAGKSGAAGTLIPNRAQESAEDVFNALTNEFFDEYDTIRQPASDAELDSNIPF